MNPMHVLSLAVLIRKTLAQSSSAAAVAAAPAFVGDHLGRSRLRSRSRPSSQRACLFATATVPSPTPAMKFAEESKSLAAAHGYSDFEQWLTAGGDDRSLIKPTGANKYHIKPQPIEAGAVFRGSCTGNPPTQRGYDASEALYGGTLVPVADDQR